MTRILSVLRSFFAPEAADAIRQQVARFTNCRRSYQSIDECILEFDPLRRKAESEMETGAGFPEQFVATLRMNNAGLPRKEESLVMAIRHKSLKSKDVAANARRSFGSRGGGGRQDA